MWYAVEVIHISTLAFTLQHGLLCISRYLYTGKSEEPFKRHQEIVLRIGTE